MGTYVAPSSPIFAIVFACSLVFACVSTCEKRFCALTLSFNRWLSCFEKCECVYATSGPDCLSQSEQSSPLCVSLMWLLLSRTTFACLVIPRCVFVRACVSARCINKKAFG